MKDDGTRFKHPVGPDEHVPTLKYMPFRARRHAVKSCGRKVSMLSSGERQLLFALPFLTEDSNFANLGHHKGGSALLLALGLKAVNKTGCVHSVDVFFDGGAYSPSKFEGAKERIKEFDLESYIKVYTGFTIQWAQYLAKQQMKFDAVFVDADHRYSGVYADIVYWGPMIKKGGYILLHDTDQEGCHCAVEELLCDSPNWQECKDLHIYRIRTFKRV